MNVQVLVDNHVLPCKLNTFSDGASTFEVLDTTVAAKQHVTVNISDVPADSVLWLATLIDDTLMDVIQNYGRVDTTLYLPYLPHARADRPFSHGMINTLDSFLVTLGMITHFDHVRVVDAHNEAAFKQDRLPYSAENVAQHLVVNTMIPGLDVLEDYDAVVAPDKGAALKAAKIGHPTTFYCSKARNPSNGWIERFDLPIDCDVKGKNVIIVDDICDGGMTFIKCGEALKRAGAKSVALYVTHGIFSKGLRVFDDYIDKIFTYQLVGGHVTAGQLRTFNASR